MTNFEDCENSIDELLYGKTNERLKAFLIYLKKNEPDKISKEELELLRREKDYYNDVAESLDHIIKTYA